MRAARGRYRRDCRSQEEGCAGGCAAAGSGRAEGEELPRGWATVSLRIDVPEVTVDVGVLLEKTHQFVPGLKPDNFRVYEDGVEQKVIGFKRVEAPITALLLCEFAANSYYFIYDMRNAALAFAQQLRPQDYVALMTFDMRTQIVTDFTQDKQQSSAGASTRCGFPGFSETNVFDALYEGWTGCTHRRPQVHHPDCVRARHVFKADAGQDSQEGEGIAGHHHLHDLNGRDDAGDDRRPGRDGRRHARHGLPAGR